MQQITSRYKKPSRHKKIIIFILIFIIAISVTLATIFIVKSQQNSSQDQSQGQSQDQNQANNQTNQAGSSQGQTDSSTDETQSTENSESPNSQSSTGQNTPATNPTTASLPNSTGNCTTKWGNQMLINYNFTVDQNFINGRKAQLINLTETYGINELNSYNGVPLLDAEAATHLNDMVKAYQAEHPNHEMKTVSCFRSYGTSCGRLCAATGTSEHHSGYACDLIDAVYGTSLDTDDLPNHLEWQWLKENSYKYGFIDRYPLNWAGGSMAAPINVDANGSTGYYETWHYRYVGVPVATAIATGKYNGGVYDSFEHYLKSTGALQDLTSGQCE